ncbi:uncharacterized protein LOC116619504 [Nematostella vectensis]|nr:uncharacterized protein LOC116619504 [Nematostella vectensis]
MDLGLFVLLLQCVALLAKMCASQVLQASNGGFLKEKKMYLNVTVKEVHKVNRVAQCAVKSMRDHKSYSFNFAVKPDECGTYLCEVLYTDRYNDSDKYHKNENFDHYNKKSACASSPCPVGSFCQADYEHESYTCRKIICEKDLAQLSCLDGFAIDVEWALWGRSSMQPCPHPKAQICIKKETVHETLQSIRGLCQDKNSCSFTANNTVIGHDPCAKIYKYLELRYVCKQKENK